MASQEKMTIDERRKYLKLMQERYWQADQAGRSPLLDEMEAVTGLHRKSLIRLLRGNLGRKPRQRQRGRTYGPEVDDTLRVISESFDGICAERLQPNLVWMAKHMAHHRELAVNEPLLQQLDTISLSTVRRMALAALAASKPRSTTPGTQTVGTPASLPGNSGQTHGVGFEATGSF